MTARILLLAFLYASMFVSQRLVTRKMGWREKTVYAFLLVFSLYEAIDYAGNWNWMELYEWNDLVLGNPARSIERFLSYKPK